MGSEKLVCQNGPFYYPTKDYTLFLSLHFCKKDMVFVLFPLLPYIQLKIENSKKMFPHLSALLRGRNEV